MACPYFLPLEKFAGGGWLHPSRLPLGAGWKGNCGAPGHDRCEPSTQELRDFCNLGYATGCSRLPVVRDCDAVRFSVARDGGSKLLLWVVYERAHRPAGHGTLEYDRVRRTWTRPHEEPGIQKMADCYLQSYLERTSYNGRA